MKLKKIICIIFCVIAVASAFSGCVLSKVIDKTDEISSKKIQFSMLEYEENLHNKEFEIVSFEEGRGESFLGSIGGASSAIKDKLVLKYEDCEFEVYHYHGYEYDSDHIRDNFVFALEKDNIINDLQKAFKEKGYDILAEVDTTETSSAFTAQDGKYSGIYNKDFFEGPEIDIHIFTGDKTCETYESVKGIAKDAYWIFMDLFGVVPDCNMYFYDNSAWTKEEMESDMQNYPGIYYGNDCNAFIYTTDNKGSAVFADDTDIDFNLKGD